jgi:hypothetical protein
LSEAQTDDFVPYVPDASTFSEGGNAARLNGKPVDITSIYAITTVATKKDGTPRSVGEDGQGKEQTFLRVEYTPRDGATEEDKKPASEEYLLGGSAQVRASADGDQILLKPGKGLFRKLDGAKFFDAAEKSGLGPMTGASLKAHFLGQGFEVGGVAEEYETKDKGPDGKPVKKTFVRLFPAKHLGKGAGTVASAAAPADLDTTLDGIVLGIVASAPGNSAPVALIQSAVFAQFPEGPQRQTAVKRVFSSEYQGKQGRGFTFGGGVAKLAA